MSIFKSKFILSSLFLCLLYPNLFGKTHTNKTFLTPRNVSQNIPLEFSTWRTQLFKTKKDKIKGSFQAATFYQKSTNKSDLGKYFGIYASTAGENRNYLNVDHSGAAKSGMTDPDALWAYYTAHLSDPSAFYPVTVANFPKTNLDGKIEFKPYQEAWGLNFNYYQNFNCLIKGIFFEIKVPYTQVKNSLNIKNLSQIIPVITDENDYPANYLNILDYLNGNLKNELDGSDKLQTALQKAKYSGSRTKDGVPDVDLKLGYNFFEKRYRKLSLAICLDIPAGNKATGEYLFEPLVGNGQHWGLGAEIDSRFTFWHDKNNSIEILPVLNLKYFFSNTQARTLGFKNTSDQLINFGHYYLGGQVGQNSLFPLANVLTQNVKVTPGWQFEGILNLEAKLQKFIVDIGYDLFVKESEKVSLKNAWQNDTYAVASYDYDTSSAYAITAANIATDIMGTAQAIQSENIDLNVAKTPSQVTNKIYGAIGYQSRLKENSIFFGLGASYEFASNNAALEGYSVWTKFGFDF